MSTLKANNLDTESGTTITVAAGKTLAGTDIIGATQIADAAISNAKLSNMAANTVKVRDADSSGVPSDKALATTEILIGDGTGFTAASLSGDATMTNAGAVTIADNAVSLSKLADGTQGDILYYGASGAPALLGVGTSGQFLKTQGAGANPVWAAAGGDNTPAFAAYLNASITTFPDETWTKVAINAEHFDTDSAYDPSTNYRFTVPSGEGGKYYLSCQVTASNGNNDGEKFFVGLYKNGSRVGYSNDEDNTSDAYGWNTITGQFSTVLTLAAADYVECFAYTRSQNGGGTPHINGAADDVTYFFGYKMIGL